MSDWYRCINLSYRVFLRQREDVTSQFEHVKSELSGKTRKGLRGEIDFHAPADTYWQLAPEDVEKARAKGYLVVERQESLWAVVRELRITIRMLADDDDVDVLDNINQVVPLDQFAVVQVLRGRLAGFQAL